MTEDLKFKVYALCNKASQAASPADAVKFSEAARNVADALSMANYEEIKATEK